MKAKFILKHSSKRAIFGFKGGPGSGFHGHSGRPGEVGGSSGKGVLHQETVNELSKSKSEKLLALDENGNVTRTNIGEHTYISNAKIPAKTFAIVHNHPSHGIESPFSAIDVGTALKGSFEEFYVVDSTKTVYILGNLRNARKSIKDISKVVSDYKKYQELFKNETMFGYKRKIMALEKLAKLYGFTYNYYKL